MLIEHPSINVVPEDEFDIDEVRAEWCGRKLGESVGRYPVEHDPIRRFCHMTGETNPMYLDPVAAAAGPFGAVQCPPAFVRYFIGGGPWPVDRSEPSQIPSEIPRLGDRGVNMSIVWTFHEPVVVGDRLRAIWTVEDVYVKPTRLDPRSVWIVTSAVVRNQHDTVVAALENTVLYHRPATAVPPSVARDTMADASATEQGGASLVECFELELTPSATALQVSGSQDWSLVHHDPEFARSSGHDRIFFNTAWTQGMLGRVVADYIGDRSWWLRELRFSMRRMNSFGDTVTGGYRPPSRAEGSHTLDVELRSDRSGRSTIGVATIDPDVTHERFYR